MSISTSTDGESEPRKIPHDLVEVLQDELVRRCRKNPKYSLRAFAKSLSVDPSLLSKIMNRRRQPSTNMMQDFARRLEISPETIADFERSSMVSAMVPEVTDLDSFKLVSDQFALIANWYHYAIFELVEVEGFEPTGRWIAKTLGISIAEAKLAFDRLIRMGFISENKRGKFKKTTRFISTTGNPFTTAAFRNLQREVLEKALEALENIPFEERDQSSMTVALPSSALEVARKKIEALRLEIGQMGETKRKKDKVFNLSVSLYPVSKKVGG